MSIALRRQVGRRKTFAIDDFRFSIWGRPSAAQWTIGSRKSKIELRAASCQKNRKLENPEKSACNGRGIAYN